MKKPSSYILFTSQQMQPRIPNDSRFAGDIIFLNNLSVTQEKLNELYKNTSQEPFTQSTIFGPDGNPLNKNDKSLEQIITSVSEVNDELLEKLSDNPELFYKLSPRKFEEVIAEILHRQGYEITITPFSKDGGIDIYAAKKDFIRYIPLFG